MIYFLSLSKRKHLNLYLICYQVGINFGYLNWLQVSIQVWTARHKFNIDNGRKVDFIKFYGHIYIIY